jgi:hypothetical protein
MREGGRERERERERERACVCVSVCEKLTDRQQRRRHDVKQACSQNQKGEDRMRVGAAVTWHLLAPWPLSISLPAFGTAPGDPPWYECLGRSFSEQIFTRIEFPAHLIKRNPNQHIQFTQSNCNIQCPCPMVDSSLAS